MTTLETKAPARAARLPIGLEARRTVSPVKWWAGLGVAVLAFQGWVLIRWISSGDTARAPFGPDPVPHWQKLLAHGFEAAGIVAALAAIWFLLVRPWRRTGHLTVDGVFMIGVVSFYWQNPLWNYVKPWYTYNSILLNWGSWTTSVPGWLSPKGTAVLEPVVFALPCWIYCIYLVPNLIAKLVFPRMMARFPHLGTFGLIAWCWAVLSAICLVLDGMWIRSGLYTYGGADRDWSLFAGTRFQYPIYMPIIWGGMWTVLACLRHFVDDRQETWAERGVNRIKGGAAKRTALRCLAMVGLCNLIYALLFNLPIQWFTLHADPWPADIVNRSYLTNGLCGPANDLCPVPAKR